MKFKAYASVLLIAVFLSSSYLPAEAASIAGTKCSKVGSTKTTGGVKYSCVKSGKKLIWNKGTKSKSAPTQTNSATATPSPTNSATATPSPTASSGLTQLTLEEVKKHDSAASCWSIVFGNVFDLTTWITKHPGGAAVIRAICGKDGTAAFEGQHAGQGKPASAIANYYVGKLGDSVKI